jgi:hypothetical protein
VRVVGVPELPTAPPDDELQTPAVFDHLRGTYRRIADFDGLGNARIELRIRQPTELAGLHTVWIEPWLLRKRRRRARLP